MNPDFVMTDEDIAEMKLKANEAKCHGIQSKDLAQTSYEKRCKDPQIQPDLNGWEPDEEFMEWLLKETSETWFLLLSILWILSVRKLVIGKLPNLKLSFCGSSEALIK